MRSCRQLRPESPRAEAKEYLPKGFESERNTISRKMTGRRADILAFIISFLEKHNYPPSIREIGDEMGLRSSSTVHLHLRALQQLGYIEIRKNGQRSIKVCERGFAEPVKALCGAILEHLHVALPEDELASALMSAGLRLVAR